MEVVVKGPKWWSMYRFGSLASPMIRVYSTGTPRLRIVVVMLWMSRAPTIDPSSEKRPPVSAVPPMTTARIASSSRYRPALLASAPFSEGGR